MSEEDFPTNFIARERNRLVEEKNAKFRQKYFRGFFRITIIEIIFLVLFAASVPVLIYYFLYNRSVFEDHDDSTCLVNLGFRVPCGRENISDVYCKTIGCCFDPDYNSCFHYLPSRYEYKADEDDTFYKPTLEQTPLGNKQIKEINIYVEEIDENRVSLKVDTKKASKIQRYLKQSPNFKVQKIEDHLMVEVTRNDDLLLTTSRGPLIVSDQYWEWTVHLTNEKLYGLGEMPISLEEGEILRKIIYPNRADHTTKPVFWALKNGNFHGIDIKHDGPIEIMVLSSNLIILRGIVGTDVQIELFVGTTPASLRKLMNPQTGGEELLDSLMKTHLCRSSNTTKLTEMLQEFDDDRDNFDTECIHENLFVAMTKLDQDGKEDLKTKFNELIDSGKSIYLAIPPHIFNPLNGVLYDKALELNMLYQYSNGTDFIGQLLNEDVVYPDFGHSSVTQYLDVVKSVIEDYVEFDKLSGFFLVKNWPDNELEVNLESNFLYLPQNLATAMVNTIDWDATVNSILHINKHNTYGEDMAASFREKFSDKIVLSASNTFGGFNPAIVDNVETSWSLMKQVLKSILFNSVIGNYFVYFPVCGTTASFDSTNQEALCVRWYLIAATLPTFMVSSELPRRNPVSLPDGFSTIIVNRAMETRRKLLPLYKTLMRDNQPLVTPMWYYYFQDNNTLNLDEQYMLGDDILVAHPFTPKQTSLKVYLPKGLWYELWDGQFYNITKSDWTTLSIIDTDWISFLREESVVALLDGANLEIIIGLSCSSFKSATGELVLDNGFLSFEASDDQLIINKTNIEDSKYSLSTIKLYNCGTNSLIKDLETPLDGDVIPVLYRNNVITSTESSTVEETSSTYVETTPTVGSTSTITTAETTQTTSSDITSSSTIETTSSDITSSSTVEFTSSDITSSSTVETTSTDLTSSSTVESTSSDITSSSTVETTSSDITSSSTIETTSSDITSSSTIESTSQSTTVI